MPRKTNKPEPEAAEPLETVTETSRYINVSERTVRRWIAAGDLPVVRFGRIVRIRPKDRKALIKRHLS